LIPTGPIDQEETLGVKTELATAPAPDHAVIGQEEIGQHI